MIHPISDTHLSVLGSCILLLLAMPRIGRSLLSKLSPLRCLKFSSRSAPKPKPPPPGLLSGLSAISHILVVVVASNLACGPAFETRLFITLRQQLLEFSRPAALLAASTAIPVPRRESKKIASVCNEKPEGLDRCDSAQPQSAEMPTPISAQDDRTPSTPSAHPSPPRTPLTHPSPLRTPLAHPSPPSAPLPRPSTPNTPVAYPSSPLTYPSPPRTPLSRPPPIPRRSSSLNKAFDARRIKLVVSPSSSSSSISSSSERESRARRRPDTATGAGRMGGGRGTGELFRVTLSEKKGDRDPRVDARVRMELDPGMWLRSGRVAASGRVM